MNVVVVGLASIFTTGPISVRVTEVVDTDVTVTTGASAAALVVDATPT